MTRLRRSLGKAAWTLGGKAREAPEELFMAAVVLLSGITLLLAPPKPTSLNALLPHWLVVLWASALVIGGALICLGMFRRGFAAELAGLTLLAWVSPAYAVLVFYRVGERGIFTVAIVLAYAAACGWRAHAVARFLRKARSADGAQ